MLSNKEIQELIDNQIVSEETAKRITQYYQNKTPQNSNKLYAIFGVLGAVLIGMGIILLVAHNWDNLPKGIKTLLAFVPMSIGQIAGIYTLLKKQDNVAWREGSAVFIFFGLATAIALISQIYHIPGNINAFLLTWMLLTLPLIYTLSSSLTSLFYVIGITYYGVSIGYWKYPNELPYYFWLLLAGILPYYYRLYKEQPKSNFITFHHWLIALSVVITLGTLSKNFEEFMFVPYVFLFGIYTLLGNSSYFKNQSLRNNAYLVIGSVGSIILLLMLSYREYWDDLKTNSFQNLMFAPELYVGILLFIIAILLIFKQYMEKTLDFLKPLNYVFLFFIPIFILGLYTNYAVVLINLLVLGIGLIIVWNGIIREHLGILNFGLLIVTNLVACRFFDTNLSFVLRGLLFIGVGFGFFAANYWLIKKKKQNEK